MAIPSRFLKLHCDPTIKKFPKNAFLRVKLHVTVYSLSEELTRIYDPDVAVSQSMGSHSITKNAEKNILRWLISGGNLKLKNVLHEN